MSAAAVPARRVGTVRRVMRTTRAAPVLCLRVEVQAPVALAATRLHAVRACAGSHSAAALNPVREAAHCAWATT